MPGCSAPLSPRLEGRSELRTPAVSALYAGCSARPSARHGPGLSQCRPAPPRTRRRSVPRAVRPWARVSAIRPPQTGTGGSGTRSRDLGEPQPGFVSRLQSRAWDKRQKWRFLGSSGHGAGVGAESRGAARCCGPERGTLCFLLRSRPELCYPRLIEASPQLLPQPCPEPGLGSTLSRSAHPDLIPTLFPPPLQPVPLPIPTPSRPLPAPAACSPSRPR